MCVDAPDTQYQHHKAGYNKPPQPKQYFAIMGRQQHKKGPLLGHVAGQSVRGGRFQREVIEGGSV